MTDQVANRYSFLISTRLNDLHARYQRSLNSLGAYPKPQEIPITIINDLDEAAQSGLEDARTLLVQLLRTRRTGLTPQLTFQMLESYSSLDKDAANECALAYIGMGRFKPETSPYNAYNVWLHFYDAIRLGHKSAFRHMLDAICDDKLAMTGEQFKNICQDLVRTTKNVEVAISFGTLLCQFPIVDRPELAKLGLNNPNLGYIYLRYGYCHGDTHQSTAALDTLGYGYTHDVFTSPSALKFKEELLASMAEIPIEAPVMNS